MVVVLVVVVTFLDVHFLFFLYLFSVMLVSAKSLVRVGEGARVVSPLQLKR